MANTQAAVAVERSASSLSGSSVRTRTTSGNFQESPFPPAEKIVGNTSYEEITCVGYNPDKAQLEATALTGAITKLIG